LLCRRSAFSCSIPSFSPLSCIRLQKQKQKHRENLAPCSADGVCVGGGGTWSRRRSGRVTRGCRMWRRVLTNVGSIPGFEQCSNPGWMSE
jgi:hypothetical protein